MGKMDKLWKTFDQAVDKLPNNDAFAFKRYSEHLDNFFVCYWSVFDAESDDSPVDTLIRIADTNYEESVKTLESTWRNTTDALHRYALELKDKRIRTRTLPQLLKLLQKAERQLKLIRNTDNIDKRIKGHRDVADILEDFISRVEAAN